MFFDGFPFSLGTAQVTFEKDWLDFRFFAIKQHGKQMYGDHPYAYHLAMVEAYMMEYGFNEHHFQAGAWLHDVIEDTECDYNRINDSYGGTITAIVWACTGEGKNRKERAESIYKKLAEYPLAAPVKVADRLANVFQANISAQMGDLSKIKMYLKEWPKFKENLEPLMQDDKRKLVFWGVLSDMMDTAEFLVNNPKKEEEEKSTATEEPPPSA